jgi:hypothetical protein
MSITMTDMIALDAEPAPIAEAEVSGAELAFVRCIDRLDALITAETETLTARAPFDFDASNQRKTHALLELVRASRATPSELAPPLRDKVLALREKLNRNAELLDQHLRAMLEIASIMIATIRAEESDGTYCGQSVRRR